MSSKTYQMAKEAGLTERRWFVVDEEGAVLGRLATRVAGLLRGKGKPGFTPHVDCGDFVVVINASKVRLTGNKENDKIYRRHTLYPGGIRTLTAAQVREKHPEDLVTKAMEGMLPNNRLGRALATKLKVYPGAEHPHQAQQPEPVAAAD
jgi:large subunit ribosomal protein L13